MCLYPKIKDEGSIYKSYKNKGIKQKLLKMNNELKNVFKIIQNVFDFLDDMYQVQNFISIRLQMQEVQKKQPLGLTKNNLYTEGTLFAIIEGIDLLKDRLEHRSGFELNLEKTSQLEIVITCQNFHRYHCGFKYLFRKYNEDPQKVQYILVTEFESHHLECLEELKLKPKHKQSFIASPSFRRYKPDLQNQFEEISPKILNLVECTEKLSKELQEEFILLQNKHSTKLYTEQQVTTLKKELQFQSKGLLSKSTQFHPENGYIVKISFKCKYQNGNCPYLATLNYTYQRNQKHQKLFRLQKIVKHHDSACILDDQDIHYNVVTRKIDENIQILVKILQQNSKDIKPKRVLQLFAQYLSQDPDFIYNGISSKINRRAVKKYFDNSVAKARNMTK